MLKAKSVIEKESQMENPSDQRPAMAFFPIVIRIAINSRDSLQSSKEPVVFKWDESLINSSQKVVSEASFVDSATL